MAGIRQQILGIIKTCETALASKKDDLYVDENTISVSAAILKKAKADLPNDEVLAAAILKAPYSWQQILSAMQTAIPFSAN
jgi:hypothetical protein